MKLLNTIYPEYYLPVVILLALSFTTGQTIAQHDVHDHAHEEVVQQHDADHDTDSHEHHDEGEDVDHADDHDEAGHEHEDHADTEQAHDDHAHADAEHDDSHDEGLQIAPDILDEFGIVIQTASIGAFDTDIELSGEVVFNADRVAHVTPSVAGITRQVLHSVGDRIKAGDLMAVLSSRDLAAARSAYLAALANKQLADEMLDRDQRLVQDGIGSERELLESQQKAREAEIAMKLTEQHLHALGEDHESIHALPDLEDTVFAVYQLHAPIDGIVIERHMTHGEQISDDTDAPPFVIADLSSVWVDLAVYQRDLANIKPGQSVRIEFGHGIPDAIGTIDYLSPAFDEHTRTATARVVLDNPDGHWRPGLFVTGYVSVDQNATSVIVPLSAVTEIDGERVIFVQDDDGFEPRTVTIGMTTETHAQIISGLEPGERYVARNVLALKGELNRAELEHAGHVH